MCVREQFYLQKPGWWWSVARCWCWESWPVYWLQLQPAREIGREMSVQRNFSIQPNSLALSEHLVPYPKSVCPPGLPPTGTRTTLAQLIIHTATLTLMLKSTVNTQTFPPILAICWANQAVQQQCNDSTPSNKFQIREHMVCGRT